MCINSPAYRNEHTLLIILKIYKDYNSQHKNIATLVHFCKTN